jgi:hypothetical protein
VHQCDFQRGELILNVYGLHHLLRQSGFGASSRASPRRLVHSG